MARMYSRRKGKAGSHKPSQIAVPSWMSYKEKEIEMLITKLAKEGNSPSRIGSILRDTYGIPDVRVILKKQITGILREKGLLQDVPEDLLSLIKRSILISKHIEANRRDQTAKRGMILTESKIRRLIKYYKGTGRLSQEWKYDPKMAGMFAE